MTGDGIMPALKFGPAVILNWNLIPRPGPGQHFSLLRNRKYCSKFLAVIDLHWDSNKGKLMNKLNVGPTTGTESILDGITLARQEVEDRYKGRHLGVVLNDDHVKEQGESLK